MKNKLHYFILLFVLAALTGCNEKLSIETEIQGAPEISEFTPTSGKAGTEITVKGSNLRDIVSATIGGVQSQILYKLSQQEIVIVVPREGTKSGKIVLATSRKDDAGESTRAESAQSFSVTYPTPRVTDFPKGGRVGNNVEILGADLDIISKVFMGDEEGEIIYQSEKEIAVKVPFIIDDEATVSLKYANQTGGESEIKGESGDFIVEKDEPEIEKIDQESLMERSLLTLGGKNLNLIEYIYFGEEKYAPVSQNGSTIVFRVPTLPETRTVKIKVTYYRETKEIILSDACEVIRMKNLFSANQAIGTRNSKYGYGSMLNGNSADGNPICTPCVLKEEENFDKIDFAGYVNSGLDFALNSPDAILNPDPANTKNNLKNYWCGTAAVPNAENFTIFAPFTAVQTRFFVLNPTTHAALIEQIRAGRDQLEITPSLFTSLNITKSSARTRKSTEAAGTVSEQIFDKGSVVVFYNNHKDKYGILDILDVFVDYSQTNNINNGDKNNQGIAYITFDVYYQR